jgi:SAM-dependent methyltransferase
VRRIDDPAYVAREYASLERLAMRRLDRTGWLRFGGDDALFVLLRAVAELRPQRVLDAACGDGWVTSMISAPEVIGIDLSPTAVEAARSRGLDARVADVQKLPFADGSFDVVLCNYALDHVRNRRKAIAELARVVRPGGRFLGVYNGPDHLSELWTAVDRSVGSEFDCATGPDQLAASFERVECRTAHGSVAWLTRSDLQAYLDAYSEIVGALEAPAEPYPFLARRRNGVLIGDRA